MTAGEAPTRAAYLGLGSNLGDRLGHLQGAVDGLAAAPEVTVTAVSAVYETVPVGGPPQPDYLNAVVAVTTTASARRLLDLAHALEDAAGRVRHERWGPRTLDVDLLVVEGVELAEPDLQLPHPRLAERGFAMAPLADVAPDLAAGAGPEARDPAGGWAGVRRTDLSLRVP